MVSDLLHHLKPTQVYRANWDPRALRALVEVLTKPLSIIYKQSWMLTGAFPASWMLPHGMFIYTKGSKEDPGNSRLVSQTLVCIRVWSRSSGALQHGTYRTTRSQAQPAWVCERQIPLDQTDLLPWAGNLCGGISERLWILSDWNLVRSLTEFVLTKHATEKLSAHGLHGCTPETVGAGPRQ